jgi:acetolactate synthase I/II/III large subunit
MPHGGNLLINALSAHGVSHVFFVPGESYLAALDALHEHSSIHSIMCRHECGATMMAEAFAKITGRPGVAFATRGPGATNAAGGVYVAREDATPMVLFIGLPPVSMEGRAPFQEIDIEGLYAPIAKRVEIVRETRLLPERVAAAFHDASQGRPGPVVLGLPENILSAEAQAAPCQPVAVLAQPPSETEMTEALRLISQSKRPIVIAGGGGWTPRAAAATLSFAEKFDIPVATAFRCQDYVDNRHRCHAGHASFIPDAKLAAGLASSDLIIALGAELGDVTTGGYRYVGLSEQTLILAHPDPAAAPSVCRPTLTITANAEDFATALAALDAPADIPWSSWRKSLRSAYEASLVPLPTPGELKLAEVAHFLSEALPDDAIVTNGAGNYMTFLHRYFVYKGFPTQLAPASGYMGYGLPAGIAAKLAFPDRPVVALAGDGCFQMTSQEISTAVQHNVPIVLLIANNGIHGTIRMHQERTYPGRVSGTSLVNPDFASLARGYGAIGETVARGAEFEPAFRRALGNDRLTVLDLKLDPEAITPVRTLSEFSKIGRAPT